jgi:hypothetical protein
MPGFDRTGPEGAGPMTGRQLGRCAGNTSVIPGRGYRGGRFGYRGRGFGWGRGLGFRWGNPFRYYADDYIPASDETVLENEVRTLRDQLNYFEKELEKVRKEKKED